MTTLDVQGRRSLTDVDVRSVCGQLSFGFLADKYGRTRLYGIELILVIVSTIGVATSSFGHGDMNFLALFTFVRTYPSLS
jgi:MFS family permease